MNRRSDLICLPTPPRALFPNDYPDVSHLLFFNPTSVDRFPPDGSVGDDDIDIDRGGKLKGGSSPGQAGRAPEAIDRFVLRGHRDRISVVREGGVSMTNAWETREAENARAAATAAASVVVSAPLRNASKTCTRLFRSETSDVRKHEKINRK